MRHKILLFCCFLGLCFSNPALAQSFKRSFFKSLISPDSLRGFDEDAYNKAALEQGLYGEEYKHALYYAKRQYIIDKYYPNTYDITNFKTLPATVFAAPCVNEGFELGNFSGWTATIGTNTNSCAYPTATNALAPGPLLSIVSTPLFDPIPGVTVPNSPLGGNFVAKINNTSTGGKVIKLTQNFAVTNSNYLYDFVYFGVQNGPHTCCQQPYMFVKLRDCVGNLLSCPQFTFNPPATNSTTCPGTGPVSWSVAVGGATPIQVTNGWQKYSIDLTQYIGTCVTVEVLVADCSPTGHYLYTYFDSNCGGMNVTVNGTPVSMPTTTVNVSAPCGTTATLTAPSGLAPYSWTGPAGSGITSNTNQTISTPVAGNYTLQMTPVGICNPIFRIVNLQFAPPVTITPVPSSTICTGNSATLTATGATNFTWMPGGSTSSSIVVTPTTTTIYTLTAQAGTCIGTFTRQITVNPNSTISITASSSSVCSGGPSTLTATGASSYTWSTGATTSSIVVTPTTNTTYSVIGATGGACTATASINVGVAPTPTNMVAIATPSYICPGSTSNLFGSAVGATSYSWLPGPVAGNFISVTPTATTIYTLVAANGSCTNSAQVTVSVNPGPTLTPAASPTAICPGGSSTLSASGALSYTWNPGGTIASSISVSPASTTVYSVTGVDALGCTKTSTLSLVVNSVPTVVISPATVSLCTGSSATLAASGATSYTWNPGGTTASSLIVSPASNTTYTVTGSNGTCTNSATRLVTVVPVPTVSASSSTNAICSGSSVTLTAAGATSYTWMPGSLSGASVSASPTITTTYTLTGSSNGCSATATIGITVNNGPSITTTASPLAICPGNSSSLTASGAVAYTWNPGGTNGSSVSVSPLTTTIYSVTGSSALGCLTTSTLNLTVNPNPTITVAASSATICAGSTATLTASGASGYTWNPGGLTGSSFTASPASTTTYTVIGTNGTCTNSATFVLNVTPIPTISASSSTNSICSGSSVTLTATGASTYTWNPGALNGASVSVSPTITTTYTINGSTGSCTGSTSILITVNNGPTLTTSSSPTAVCPGNSATLTAAGAMSYTWMPGSQNGNTVNVSPVSTTVYSVTGSSALGCTTTQTVSLTVNPNPTVTASASSGSVCTGSNATLTAGGATTYTWMPGNLSGASVVVTPTINTTYSVTGSTLGCTGQNTIAINVVPVPTINATSNPTAICNGASATLTASGASTYTWMPVSMSGASISVSPTISTTYTVTGNNGVCSSNTTLTLIVNPIPTITPAATPTAICVAGSVTLTANGASTYTWMPGSLTGSNVTVSPVTTTTYTVSGTSTAACTGTAAITVTVNSIPILTVVATPTAICEGSSSTLTAAGASNYTWMPGSLSGSNIVVSPTINTTYTINGASGACSSTTVLTLVVNPNPTVTASASPTNICAGSTSTLTGNGAVSYTWNPGNLSGASVTISPSATTIYTVSGSTALGCVNSSTVNLVVTPLPTITAVANPTAICTGNSSTLTASGATSYSWNPTASTGSSIVVSPTLNTTYTITGASGICTNTQTVSVAVNPLPTVTSSASSFTICAGQSTSLTAGGANSYTWNPGTLTGSNVTVSPTLTTTYTVTGTSVTGCINTSTVLITVNPLPTITISGTATNICSGGSATLTGNGGVSYFWNPGGIAGSPIVVSPTTTTTFTLFGTSGSGCVNTATTTLSVTPVPTITAISNPTAVCIGSSATLTASGATSYSWAPGALTGNSIVVSPTVTSTYTINGVNGICINTQTVSVVVNPLPTITATATSPTICAGSQNTLTASGAISYTWNPGSLTGSMTVVSPTSTTIFTVTGTNSNGCTNTGTVSITVNPLPTLSITSTATNICAGAGATLTGSGATSYTWNPGSATGSTLAVSPLITTNYTLTGSNASACTNTTVFSLSVTPVPTITAVSNPTAICTGNSTTLTASGATSYTWNPGAFNGSSVIVSPTISTTYTINGVNGICNTTQTVSVIVNPLPTLTATAASPTICIGATSTLAASGASTYTWNPGALNGNTVAVSPTLTTTYTLTGINASGCTNTTTVLVTVNPLPTISIAGSATNICSGTNATLTASGASTYTWLPGSSTGSVNTVSPSATTIYTVTGTSASGCTNTATFNLSVTPTPTITTSSSSSSICSGNSITLTAAGAVSYSWNPGSLTGTSVTVTPTLTTTYTVSGVSGICSSTAAITITVNANPTPSVSSTTTLLCSGNTATLTASGASTYTWLPSGTNGASLSVNPTITTTYTLIAGSASGCTASAAFTQSVNPTPTVTAASNPGAICPGSSATLTASGGTSYSWNPGALSGTNVIVSPTITTTYTLTGVTSGCTGTAVITVTVYTTPALTVTASPAIICLGSSSTLTAIGATNYTWLPIATTGSTAVDSPTNTSTYTVTATDNNGCSNQGTVVVSVNPTPTLSITPSSTAICIGNSATLTASGASTYTWNPGALTGTSIVVNPTISATYTINGEDAIGCAASSTFALIVYPNPTVTTASSSTAICSGNAATLTASGANSYTWEPGTLTGSIVVVNPTVTTTYTLTGSNGSCGTGTETITLVVNPLPVITASVNNVITCSTPSVTLTGNATPTNVAYLWNGPGGYTNTASTATGIAVAGNYTLTASDALTGCSASATVAVTTDTSVPTVTASSAGIITCTDLTATVTAASSATTVSYLWNGPSNFTSTAQTSTVSMAGTYTVTVTDLSSNCAASTVVIVLSNTTVPVTATIFPASCSGTMANNDASIVAAGFNTGDKYDLVSGTTYTGSATFSTAVTIPGSGLLINTLSNPNIVTPYTVRFFGTNGCYKDTTFYLMPTSCITNTVFGIAKAVSTPTLKNNGTYDVDYFIIVKNTGTQQLDNISLVENLSATFPLPVVYSVVAGPTVISQNSSITINSAFNGSVQTVMTNSATSMLAAGKTDTIRFTVNLNHNGNFGPFYNTVLGFSSPTTGVVFSDSSNTGYDPDPDNNGTPMDNSIPTPLTLTPDLFFGLTKAGTLSQKLDDNTFDITYTITVHNRGNDTLRNVVVKDSLFNNTIKNPATYSIKSGPYTTGNLSANSAFNGNSDINLLVPSQSKIAPGAIHTIIFTINVNPDTITVVKNSAFGRALSSTSITVSDTSNAGSNPDSNNNGVWNEAADNIPTVLTIPNSTLFIPQGFSPDGDGRNDYFVIKGLPSENTITIYNRWGNKVYGRDNYDNTWNGYPNVSGTLGNEKLPPGTYYYILEFRNSDEKPMTGFIVIQY